MRLNFETKIAAGSFVAVAILIAACVLSFTGVRDANGTAQMVARTYDVLTEIQAVIAAMADTEAGMRGYLLTGEKIYLERQTSNHEQIDQALARLDALAIDDETQRARMDELRAKSQEKRQFFGEIIELRERVGAVAAISVFATGRARDIVEQARALALAVEQNQRQLLATRQREAAQSAARNELIVAAAGIIDTLLLMLAVLMIYREMKARQRLERTLREDAERLAAVVKMQADIAEEELDLGSVLAMVTTRALRLTGAAGASVDVVEGDRLIERAHTGIAASTFALRRKMFTRLTADCFEREEALICEDLESAGAAAASEPSGELPARSAILVPLRSENRVIGVLKVLSERVHAFSNKDAQALELIAGFIATAMNNASAFEARQKLINELTALNEELEAFSYSVSHDLRSPLRHIAGFVELLRKHVGGSVDEKGRHYLDVITYSAEQMGKLIDDLLQFARVGRTEVRREKIDMQSLVHSTIAAVTSELRDRDVEWRVDILPEVLADASMIRQVMTNLVSNAVKYSRPRPHAVIEVGARRQNGEIIFHVRDNGVGFEPKYASKLFGVFQRLHRSDEFEGTGIGLANVRRVIHKHGGKTWAESAPEAGATFYFTLPVSPQSLS